MEALNLSLVCLSVRKLSVVVVVFVRRRMNRIPTVDNLKGLTSTETKIRPKVFMRLLMSQTWFYCSSKFIECGFTEKVIYGTNREGITCFQSMRYSQYLPCTVSWSLSGIGDSQTYIF